jgi:hypothetical protein
MSGQHTPEPWQVNHGDKGQVCDADGERRGCAPIAHCAGSAAEKRANAARIVACVNACAGMYDPARTIETMNADALTADKELARLRVQCDELLAALHRFISLCPSPEGLGGHAPAGAFAIAADHARAAIARATHP